MECVVNWTGALKGGLSAMSFVAQTGSGHTVAMDGAPNAVLPDIGGQNLAARPLELLLAGTGGCSAYDVVLMLKRGRHNILGCSVRLTAERATEDPKVFTKIHMHYLVSGKNIKDSVVSRAVALSHEKYCSAIAMLCQTAEITNSFEVINDAENDSAPTC